MTVGELRELLGAFDPSLPVFVKGYEWGWQDAPPPRQARVQLNASSAGYGGPHEDRDADDEAFQRQWAADMGDPEPVFIDAVLIPRS